MISPGPQVGRIGRLRFNLWPNKTPMPRKEGLPMWEDSGPLLSNGGSLPGNGGLILVKDGPGECGGIQTYPNMDPVLSGRPMRGGAAPHLEVAL